MTRARDIANLGTQAGSGLDASDITTGALGAGVTFPTGHIIKNHSKTFLGVQTLAAHGSNSNTVDYSDTLDRWVLVGTGASGASGDPLLITTGTPSSSSSKYLLRANVTHSKQSNSSIMMKWWYRVAGTGDYVPLVHGQDDAVSANWIRHAFGSDHHSSGSNHGVRQGNMEYLWSPGTTNSYDIQVMGFAYTQQMYINRPTNSDNNNYMGNAISTFTVQEVA